eukprot:4631812-Karenia_brevis.AAC.1
MQAGPVIFCSRCGFYSQTKLAKLQHECRGSPSTNGAKRRLEKLLKGRHPVSNESLGETELLDDPDRHWYLQLR